MDLDEYMAASNARALRGRSAARGIVIGVLLILAFVVFMIVAAPNYIGGIGTYAGPLAVIVPAVGILGLMIGLAWMVRILRAHREPEPKGWRYRDS